MIPGGWPILTFLPSFQFESGGYSARLPERIFRMQGQAARDALFQRLQRLRQALALRLVEQQVNVLGHDHVSVDAETVVAAHSLEGAHESVAGGVVIEIGLSAVAAEGQEVNLAGLLKAFQSPRHWATVFFL